MKVIKWLSLIMIFLCILSIPFYGLVDALDSMLAALFFLIFYLGSKEAIKFSEFEKEFNKQNKK